MDEDTLLKQVLEGKPGTWNQFLNRYRSLILSCCIQTASDQTTQISYYKSVTHHLEKNKDIFAAWKRKSTFEAFLTTVVHNLIITGELSQLPENKDRFWGLLEKWFGSILEREIRATAPPRTPSGLLSDKRSSIILALIENDFARLRSFMGTGTFSCFFRIVVHNLCVDFHRKNPLRHEISFEQEMGVSDEEQSRIREIPDYSYHPDTIRNKDLTWKREERFLELVPEILKELPLEQRLYLRFRYLENPPVAPSIIAKRLHQPVKKIHRLGETTIRSLKKILHQKGIKAWKDLNLE